MLRDADAKSWHQADFMSGVGRLCDELSGE